MCSYERLFRATQGLFRREGRLRFPFSEEEKEDQTHFQKEKGKGERKRRKARGVGGKVGEKGKLRAEEREKSKNALWHYGNRDGGESVAQDWEKGEEFEPGPPVFPF